MKKLREKCKNKKGFTMVELIVVIVIILVLAAVLVPSLLKYVEKANQANVKADAATLLSQVQADYAAMQASEQTEVTEIGPIDGVIITPNKADPAKGEAGYTVDTAATGYGDIASFIYNNGKYTASWAKTSGKWTITKSTTSTTSTTSPIE